MRQYLFEIVRQKWRLLSVILLLLLLDVTLSVLVSAYQLPRVADLQTKWSALRLQAARSGKVDAAALHRQGAADLEELKTRIPQKREFAAIINELLEAAADSSVEISTISYKPVQIKEYALFSYQLSFSVKGDYAAVKSYLADLQNNPELIVVDAVTFSNSDQFAEEVTMNLHVTVYLREGV